MRAFHCRPAGWAAYRGGLRQYDAAERLYAEALALRRALPGQVGRGIALGSLGHLALLRGQKTRGLGLIEESLILLRAAGDTTDVSISLGILAREALDSGDHDTARAIHGEPGGLCGDRGPPGGGYLLGRPRRSRRRDG